MQCLLVDCEWVSLFWEYNPSGWFDQAAQDQICVVRIISVTTFKLHEEEIWRGIEEEGKPFCYPGDVQQLEFAWKIIKQISVLVIILN